MTKPPWTPTCYRALDRHVRGWGWVFWRQSDLLTRLAIVVDIETGVSYPCRRGDLRRWETVSDTARAALGTLPPVAIAEDDG
jgi:hypothetical protein